MKLIEIYGQTNCSYCKRAQEFCQTFDLPFVYRDISDPAARAEMFRRNSQATTVPQIFVGERHIGGYDDLSVLPIPSLQQLMDE